MEHGVFQRDAPSTETALVIRAFRIALHLDELARLFVRVDDHAAAIVAAGRRPRAGTRADHPVLFPLPRQVSTCVLHRRLAEEVRTDLIPAALLDFQLDAFGHCSSSLKHCQPTRRPAPAHP